MSKLKKLTVIASILLLIGVLGSLLTVKQAFSKETYSDTITIDEPFHTVQLNSDIAEVEVISVNDTTAKVDVEAEFFKKSKVDFSAKVIEQILVIEFEESEMIKIGFNDSSADLKVYVPEKAYDSIDLKTLNGRIKVADLEIEKVKAKTVNGSISLQNIKAEKVEAKTVNGGIDLAYIEGNIAGKATNGKITVLTKDLERNIDLKSTNGKISIQTESDPQNTAFEISVVNGDADILGKFQSSAVIGSGENKVKLKTTNGNVTVTK